MASLWSTLSSGVQTVIGLLGFLLLSRYLGPGEYGILGMAATVVGVVGILADAGVASAIVRAEANTPTTQASAFWLTTGGALVLFLIGLISAPILASFFGQPAVLAPAVALGFQFLTAAPSRVALGLLGRELRYGTIAICTLTSSTAALALSLWAAVGGAGHWALVIQLVSAPAILSAMTVAFQPYSIAPRHVTRKAIRNLATFGSKVSLAHILVTLARVSETVIGGRLFGPDAPGLMAMASRLGFAPIQRVSWSIGGVFLPAAMKLRPEHRSHALAKALRLTTVLVGPVCALVFVGAPDIVSLLPAKWSQLTPVLRWTAIGALIEPVGTFAWSMILARNNVRALPLAALALIPFAWTSAFAGATLAGVPGIAAGWALGNWVWSLGLLFLAVPGGKEALRVLRMLLSPLLAVLPVGLAALVVLTIARPAGPWSSLGLEMISGLIAYAALLSTVFRSDLLRAIALFKDGGSGLVEP